MAAAKVAFDVRTQPGVAAAWSEVGDAGRVTVHVRLQPEGELRAAATAAAALDAAPLPGAEEVTLAVAVPAAPGLAPVEISQARAHQDGMPFPAALEAADTLRRVAIAAEVGITSSALSLRLDDHTTAGPSPLTTAAAALRGVAGVPSPVTVEYRPRDSSRSVSVEVADDGPSAELLAALDELTVRPDVSRIVHHEQRGQDRPLLDVQTDDPEAVARLLTTVADDHPPRPRTAFSAHTATNAPPLNGYVGLPLAGADPPPPAAEAAPILASYEADLRAFLLRTAEAGTATCSVTDGRSVQCLAELPLWHEAGTTTEDVEACFAAITAAWRHAGLTSGERALGTEIWSRGPHVPGPAGVDVARIRGTTDGIRVSVESPTVR
ncbi:hypothetical protein F1C12_03905 [Leifsonia shinshuensis]|uniref:Uncharacterized protein n=1 Tax=Leifsonia shinshuensis TaxID=150026 RepID=A0A7G6Y797_9MICO|nr:hypothetical protein F1C12_03905 [Leifsonia shinshuensis]